MMNEFDLLSQEGSDDLNHTYGEPDEQVTEKTEESEETVIKDKFNYYDKETPDDEDDSDESDYEEDSVLNAYLKNLGVADPGRIYWDYQDGNGPQEVDFNELEQEDQLAILQSYHVNNLLDEREIATINYFRDNNVSLEDYTEYIQRQAIEQYINSQQADITVNDLSDEELFKLDLLEQNRYVSEDQRMTQDEIDEHWENIQNSPALQKQINILRETYLESEKRLIEEQEILKSQAAYEEYAALENEIVNISRSIDTIEDITLEDNDKRVIEDLLLRRDVNGVTGLAKALNDPQTLYTTAWFLTKGSEAFDMIKSYYTKKINEVEKQAYEAGKNSTKSKPQQRYTQTDRQLIPNKKTRLEIGKHDI